MWGNKEGNEMEKKKLDPKILNILKNFRSTAKFEALRKHAQNFNKFLNLLQPHFLFMNEERLW